MKIAIISHMSHEYNDNISNYHCMLYEYWKGKHDVTEFPTFLKKSHKRDIPISRGYEWVEKDLSLMGWKPRNKVWAGSFTKKNFHKVFDNHDVVILSCPYLPKKWINHPKAIVVQHMNKHWYKLGNKPFGQTLNQFFNSPLFGVGTFINSFKNARRTMFYGPETWGFTRGKSFYGAIPYKKRADIKLKDIPRHGFTAIEDLDVNKKNAKFIAKLANNIVDLTIYGRGSSKYINKKLKNKKQFAGSWNKNSVDILLEGTKIFLLTTTSEDFVFKITQALSNGTPVIIFDTLDTADVNGYIDCTRFLSKSKAIFMVKRGDTKRYHEAISKIRRLDDKEYLALQKCAISFAKKYLSKETFWKSWNQILKAKVGMFENKWPAYELLKNKVIPVLEKENIWYSAEAGTMLGAVRHKGFIPWDDDIDLMITYEGFLQLQEKYPDNILSTDDKGYPLLFPKWVTDKKLMHSSCPAIDLFIVVPTTKKKVKKFTSPINVVRFGIQTLNRSKFNTFNWKVKIAKFFQWFLIPILWKKISIHKVVKKLRVPLKEADGYYLIENPTESWESKYCPLTMLETKQMPFEKMKINVSKEYDAILTSRFSKNYMEPHIGKHVFDHKTPISINLVTRAKLKKEFEK